MKIILRLIKDEAGQGLVEYGLIISLVVIAAVAGVRIFGESVKNLYVDIEAKMP